MMGNQVDVDAQNRQTEVNIRDEQERLRREEDREQQDLEREAAKRRERNAETIRELKEQKEKIENEKRIRAEEDRKSQERHEARLDGIRQANFEDMRHREIMRMQEEEKIQRLNLEKLDKVSERNGKELSELETRKQDEEKLNREDLRRMEEEKRKIIEKKLEDSQLYDREERAQRQRHHAEIQERKKRISEVEEKGRKDELEHIGNMCGLERMERGMALRTAQARNKEEAERRYVQVVNDLKRSISAADSPFATFTTIKIAVKLNKKELYKETERPVTKAREELRRRLGNVNTELNQIIEQTSEIDDQVLKRQENAQLALEEHRKLESLLSQFDVLYPYIENPQYHPEILKLVDSIETSYNLLAQIIRKIPQAFVRKHVDTVVRENITMLVGNPGLEQKFSKLQIEEPSRSSVEELEPSIEEPKTDDEEDEEKDTSEDEAHQHQSSSQSQH